MFGSIYKINRRERKSQRLWGLLVDRIHETRLSFERDRVSTCQTMHYASLRVYLNRERETRHRSSLTRSLGYDF